MFLDLSGMALGNFWPFDLLASELCNFSVFKVSYSAVALLSISASQLFRLSLFGLVKAKVNRNEY